MTRSIAMNEVNDIYTDAQGNLAMVTGAAATSQNSRSAMQAQRGEMIYALERGIPTLQTVWDKFDPAQFEAAARIALMRVEGVIGIQSFNIEQRDGQAAYQVVLLTPYGVIEIGNL